MSRSVNGFSLIEAVIASLVSTTVLAAVFALLQPAHGTFESTLEAGEMQQRIRVAVDSFTRDLTMAGAGAYAAGRLGPLIGSFAPVLPFRQGLSDDAAPGTFRNDTITLITVPPTAAQTTLSANLLPGELTLQAAPSPGCPAGTNLCAFAPGMPVLLFDETGNVDAFTIAAVDDAMSQLTLAARPPDSATTTYKRGTNVVQARLDVYYRKDDAALQSYQLMHYDGSTNTAPVLDHVVGLAFEYYGEARPPTLTGLGGASYGPPPPDAATTATAYPPGENCTFRIDGASGERVPRLDVLPASTAIVPLAPVQLVDGPWCPDALNANRWDADLLRIRRVAVTIRVEAALSALRGPAGLLFVNGGSATVARQWAADQEIRFEVAPRNMNPGPR